MKKRIERSSIIQNIKIANGTYKLSLFAPYIADNVVPGQFVHIKIPKDSSMLLRRPISVNGVDKDNGIIDLIYQVVGKGTRLLSGLKPKEVDIDILGPLGNGYSVKSDVNSLCLVGGGCGVAPLKLAAQKWSSLDITACIGYKNKEAAYQIDDFQNLCSHVYISTDDGSLGEKGFATDALVKHLKKQRPDLILGCGPIPMLKVLQRISEEYNIPCQISLEERMGCGIGGCLVCSCAIITNNGWDYKRVCADGPVFNSQEVMFDE